MDETLIHCFSNAENERLCIGSYTNDEILKFSLPDTDIGGRDRKFTVVKRPGAIRLMFELRRHFEIHVWTGGVSKRYADRVLDWLEEDGPLFQSRGYRSDCTVVPPSFGQQAMYLKDIAAKFGEGNLDRILLLDNNPDSSPANQVRNLVPVIDFCGNKNDDEFVLDTYKWLLIHASKYRDVRDGITDEFRLLIHNRRSRERVSE